MGQKGNLGGGGGGGGALCSKKGLTGFLGQVDFRLVQATFSAYLPAGEAPQPIDHSIKDHEQYLNFESLKDVKSQKVATVDKHFTKN